MSAVEALKAARAAGVELALDGDDLALKAASAPPAAVLDALSRHKAQIVALLRLAWLHSRCWPAWYEARKAKAASALAAMGIMTPVFHPMEPRRRAEQPPSDATRASRTAKNQFAFQRQMNGG
jgi:hypothetical protein